MLEKRQRSRDRCRLRLAAMPIDPLCDPDDLQRETALLRDQLARLEQERADLLIELRDFEQLYQARVGPLEARLAAARLHIDEYRLRIELIQWRGKALAPSQLEAEVEYRLRDQRQRAQASFEQAQRAQQVAPPRPMDPIDDLDLKTVFRELAKRSHPDLAGDEADRAVRSARMQTINALYADRNVIGLREVLRGLQAGNAHQTDTPEQIAARLKIEYDQLAAAIQRAKAEIAELKRSPLMALKIDAALARSRGRDVLSETARQMQTRLGEAESELQGLIAKFREVVEAAGLAE
jgi:hypothetical protein